MVGIQKLTIQNYPDIVKLWQEAGMEFRMKGRDHPKRIEKQLETENVIFLGKVIERRLVGFILVTHDERKGWLNRLVVHPNYRHQGIAKELISAAEEYLLREKGIEVYSALIYRDNEASISVFRASGYEQWDEVSYFAKRVKPSS